MATNSTNDPTPDPAPADPAPDTITVSGSPLPGDDAGLDGRAAVNERDADSAEAFWRKYAGPLGMGGLIDAKADAADSPAEGG